MVAPFNQEPRHWISLLFYWLSSTPRNVTLKKKYHLSLLILNTTLAPLNFEQNDIEYIMSWLWHRVVKSPLFASHKNICSHCMLFLKNVHVTTHCQNQIGWALTRLTDWRCSQWQQPLVRLHTLKISCQRQVEQDLALIPQTGLNVIGCSCLSWSFIVVNVMLLSVIFFIYILFLTAGCERVHAQTAWLAGRCLPDEGWRRQVTPVRLTVSVLLGRFRCLIHILLLDGIEAFPSVLQSYSMCLQGGRKAKEPHGGALLRSLPRRGSPGRWAVWRARVNHVNPIKSEEDGEKIK